MGILVSIGLLLVLTIAAVLIYWALTKSNTASFSSEEVLDTVKKHPIGDANSYKRIAFFSGLFIALLFVTFMIEYKTEIKEIIQQNTFVEEFEEIMEIPLTEMPPPPPPKVMAPEIVEIEDDEILEEEPPEIIIEEDEPEEVEVVVEDDEEEAIEEIVIVAEESASFPGGPGAMIKYVYDGYTYPQRDVDEGNEGTIFVKFVVEKNGSVSNIKILKGINDRLNAEAVRVIKTMPRWKPGRNGGRAVRMWFQLPIRLKIK
ncbi:MAG: energy transducer TonB [Cyclobacteriaceae bacterium]